MKNFLIVFCSFILISFKLFGASGSADTYTVTMLKVELCGEVTCSSPTEVASGSQSVNIADLSAGAEAAKFGSTSGLPIGQTFSHLRVTLDRTFTISGPVTDGSNGVYYLEEGTLRNLPAPEIKAKETLYNPLILKDICHKYNICDVLICSFYKNILIPYYNEIQLNFCLNIS